MKILVIGSGGREHALVWKIAQSPLVKKIYCAPSNPGISKLAEPVNIPVDHIEELLDFAKSKKIDLTVVGPELPLTLGLSDAFQREGLKVFGPNQKAAQLEQSKAFSKNFMHQHQIPTADFKIFTNTKEAKAYAQNASYPLVIKADGLAAGKGVLVAKTSKEALEFLDEVMDKKIFGKSGEKVVIEECLQGEELSILALLDGKSFLLLPEARDHKRIFDNDEGPNTGGMGAYSPVSWASKTLLDEIIEKVFKPVCLGLKKEKIDYCGVLYAGLMITPQGVKVLEFNVRFGDPETQVVLPRIKSDLVRLMLACCNQTLSQESIDISQNSTLCVVIASGGYPQSSQSGLTIQGLDENQNKNTFVFHAGTKQDGDSILTNGGRVLGITGWNSSMEKTRESVYQAIQKIHFEKMQYRKDIGQSGVKDKVSL